MKPIFRWTIGTNVLPIAYEILEDSVKYTLKAFGADKFDWHILYNLENEDLVHATKLYEISKRHDIKLISQNWKDFPLPIVKPLKRTRSLVYSANFMGSVWKLCPPRININTHEIMIDNDVIFTKCPPEIDEFLNSNKVLMHNDCFRFYGKYDNIIDKESIFNSGLIGLPPKYDFGKALLDTWNQVTQYPSLKYSDEQGFIIATLLKEDHIIVPNSSIPVLHADKYNSANFKKSQEVIWLDYSNLNFENYNGFHFVESNRVDYHTGYNLWKSKQQAIKKLLL